MEILIRDLRLKRNNLIQENKTVLDNAQFLRNQSKILDLLLDIEILESAQKIVNRYKGGQ